MQYTKKAVEGLSVTYPKLIHVWHLVHAAHRVSETIHVLYLNTDKLVGNVKSPAKTELCRTKAPDTPLPPTPVLTESGIWLEATVSKSFVPWQMKVTGIMLPLLQYCMAHLRMN